MFISGYTSICSQVPVYVLMWASICTYRETDTYMYRKTSILKTCYRKHLVCVHGKNIKSSHVKAERRLEDNFTELSRLGAQGAMGTIHHLKNL